MALPSIWIDKKQPRKRKRMEPLLSVSDICSRYGITEAELRLYIKFGGFPQSTEHTTGIIRGERGGDLWPESKVAAYFIDQAERG